MNRERPRIVINGSDDSREVISLSGQPIRIDRGRRIINGSFVAFYTGPLPPTDPRSEIIDVEGRVVEETPSLPGGES